VRRRHPDVDVRLDLRATDTVTSFVHIPGVYDHWSRLCEATGRIESHGEVADISGLCTLEYACGIGLHSLVDRRLPRWFTLPGRFFTYHVLNVDDRTQLLFTYVLGPGGVPVQKAVHVRSLDDGAVTYTYGYVGKFRGRPISGCAYLEYIDCR
jgi:hypothetical protein